MTGTITAPARWSGTADSFIDLRPPGITAGTALATSGAEQVGYCMVRGKNHAAYWANSATSFLDLNPGFAAYSYASAICGSQQAGHVAVGIWPDIYQKAALWSGAADSVVLLHPAGATSSSVNAMSGSHQGGLASTNGYHAALWSGTAESFVDLHPAGAALSEILGMCDTQQVGYVDYRAALWSGTAVSSVDLHPEGATESGALATSGLHQAGYAMLNGIWHAALWSGTAKSFVDLAGALGEGWSNSKALGIWSGGATTYVVGFASPVGASGSHAILWTIHETPAPPLPRLELASALPSGESLVLSLSWPDVGRGCVLESTEALSANWTIVSTAWITNANRITTTVTNSGLTRFFRLKATE